MNMIKLNAIFRVAVIAAALACAASCLIPRKSVYLQDMGQMSLITLENQVEAKIVPYDELDIIISCSYQEIARPFNIRSMSGISNGNSSTGNSYTCLVDPNGNIEIPILGVIHASGMTRLQLKDHIRNILLVNNFNGKNNR